MAKLAGEGPRCSPKAAVGEPEGGGPFVDMAVYGEYGDLVELFLVFDECCDDAACDFVVRDPAEKEAPGAGARTVPEPGPKIVAQIS